MFSRALLHGFGFFADTVTAVNAPKVAGSPLVKRENSIIAVPRQSKHLKRKGLE